MRRTLQYKINGAILITFIVIGFIFISIQLPLQNRRNEMISKKIEVLLHTLVERDREPIANEIYQGLTRALAIRLDQMKELNGILSISVFDKTGKLLVSRGPYPETHSLSGVTAMELAGDIRIQFRKWQGLFAMVYLREIRIIGEQIGFVRIAYSLEELIREQRLSWLTLSSLLAVILIVMLILLNVIMSRTIVKPILSLSGTMGRIKAGTIEQHVYRKSNDEIETLSEAFNKMSGELATSYRELELNRARLLETRLYLENIINSMPSVLLCVDNDMKITLWNLKAERESGVEAEAAVGKTLTEVFPQIADWAEKVVCRALNDKTVRKDETVPWNINGKQMYMDITVYQLITDGADGAVIRIDDVTDRKLTEEALRESQEKYRLVVENANDLIIIIQDGFIKYANPKAVSVSGYTAEELADVPFNDLILDEDKETVLSNHTAGTQGRSAPDNYSFRFRNKAGKRLWLNTSGVPISWNNRPAMLTFFRDITDQKRAEEQLLHAQKMEAIGTLAGGIAHDFNNLLQIIQGYAQLLLDNKEHSLFRVELESILRAALKGSELTRQLLTFGRKVERHQKPVDINGVVGKAKRLLSRTIPKTIEIQLILADDVSLISADPGQIEQVMINLVINARDAMPEGGKISIKTENVMLDEKEVTARLLTSPGRYVRLSISDTGQGIEKEILDHIFEPFFTTKTVGQGTGLGLSMVYGIIKDHNGAIQCYSAPGAGTTFKVYFPAVASNGKLPEEKVSPAPTPRGGTETILIVDDEETLRDVSRQILERFGYTILTATDGENALETYLREKARIHLVLLDMIMPGMDGRRCLYELLKLNPDVKVVITSGYFASGKMEATLDGARGFIKKPFDMERMLGEIRRVLDERKKSPA